MRMPLSWPFLAGLLALVGLLIPLKMVARGGPPLAQARVSAGSRYAVTTGSDTGDCTDLTNPCRTVQYAVDQASEGDEIRVAAGTYTGVNDYGGLAQVVYISKSVTIRGGYTPAFTDPPDPVASPTTLDAQGQGRVLYITGDISPTIEGLRITAGDAAGLGGGPSERDAGGGVYVISATVIISNNRLFSNMADTGGGLYLNSSDARLNGNTVFSNIANYGSGLFLSNSDVTLTSNTVTANTATFRGGGLYLYFGDAMFSANTVTANTASLRGGGLYLYFGDATLVNNVVADNRAYGRGSGLYLHGSSLRLLHTTIARNDSGGLTAGSSVDSSGIYVTKAWGTPIRPSTVMALNTILVSHTVGITVTSDNTATLEATLWGTDTWANMTDWGGAGTIITGTRNYWGNPAFVDPNAEDYHIGPGSVAIDAGIDAGVRIDIDNEPRPHQGYDLGADEYWPSGVLKRIYLPLVLGNEP